MAESKEYDTNSRKVVDDELQISSGDQPFSESETQQIKAILEEYRPDIFLSIHSGTLGLYAPYAYKAEQGKRKSIRSVVKLYGT